jgi:hypothetical protein
LVIPVIFPPGARKVRDDATPHDIRAECHDNGDRLGRVFSSLRHFISLGNDDITIETDELSDKTRETLNLPLMIPVLDCDVLPLDVAEITQTFTKRLQPIRCWTGSRIPF